MNQGVEAYKTKCLFEGRVTEQNSTYLEILRRHTTKKEYELIKPDYLTLANGDTLSEEDPFFPQRSKGFRYNRKKFSYLSKNL